MSFKEESIEYVRCLLYNSSARIYDFLDAEAVQRLVDEHLRGKEKRRLFIWSLLNFEPLRLASFTGFVCAFLSLIVAIGYFIYKLIFGSEFQLGIASLMIGFFFFMAVQLVLIGVIGEYIGAIYTQVKKKPLVIEKERINFD